MKPRGEDPEMRRFLREVPKPVYGRRKGTRAQRHENGLKPVRYRCPECRLDIYAVRGLDIRCGWCTSRPRFVRADD